MSLGLVIQLIIERKKPPFPPAPFQQWRWIRTMDREDESTPLLDEESPESPEHLRRAPVVGFIHNQSSTGGNGRRIKVNFTMVNSFHSYRFFVVLFFFRVVLQIKLGPIRFNTILFLKLKLFPFV